MNTEVSISGLANFTLSFPLISHKIKNYFRFSLILLQNNLLDIKLIVKNGFQEFRN